jgi:hypothetical protein
VSPRILILFGLFFLLEGTSSAFENFPEFQSLTETEQESFEGPSLLSPEYSGTLQGYQKPPEWNAAWLQSPQALDLMFGSLDTRRFLMDQRLKFRTSFTDFLDFRFTSFNEGTPERQSQHHVLELIFWPFPKIAGTRIGLSLYGEPSFRKVNDDTGVALLLQPSATHEIRLFNTFIDVTRLKYPDRPDTHLETALPEARGIVGRLWQADSETPERGNFLEYAVRSESKTRWLFLEENYEYQYWKLYASTYARKQLNAELSTAFRVETDRKFEARLPFPGSSEPEKQWLTERWMSFWELTHHGLGPSQDWALTGGFNFSFRRWRDLQAVALFRDLTPYARIKVGGLTLSYLTVFHEQRGAPSFDLSDGVSDEHRFQIRYDFSFGKKGAIVLLAAGDVDQMFTPKSWGGGSAHLQLLF